MNLKVSYKEHMKKISKVIQCKKRIFEIDNADTLFDIVSFAKGFSIVAIVLFHLIHDFMSDMPKVVILASIFGGSGVHVFFVCSGVGLFFSYLKNTVKWGEYIVKRIKKVYIPYFIVVVVSFFVPWYCLDEGYNKLGALFSHIFLYKMFSPTYEVSLGRQLWLYLR